MSMMLFELVCEECGEEFEADYAVSLCNKCKYTSVNWKCAFIINYKNHKMCGKKSDAILKIKCVGIGLCCLLSEKEKIYFRKGNSKLVT